MTDGFMQDQLAERRRALVEQLATQLRLADPRILEAFLAVPRHEFVPRELWSSAYEDRALPIGEGQTISQPTMIAIMLDALGCQAHERVLEVGAGCGYAAALLGQLTREVYGIEILPGLAHRAQNTLSRLGMDNVHVVVGDGHAGLPAHAPYDAILVSAAPESVPAALVSQLAPDGRIAIPVGDFRGQVLRVGQRVGDDIEWRASVPCMFVPLVHG